MRIGRKTGPRPVESYFPEAQQLGIDWLELGCEAPPNYPQTFDEKRINGVKDLAQKYGISFGLHSGSYVNSAELMPTVHKAVNQHLIEYIELAARMQASYLVIHCGYHFSMYMDDVYQALLATFHAAVDAAEKNNVNLLIENMNLLPVEAEIRYLGCTVEELEMVFDDIESPYLGLALDVGHANLLQGGVEPFIEKFASRIGGLHLHDNDGVIDRHWPLGVGTVPWANVISRLRQIGYTGTYTIELRDYEDVLTSVSYLDKLKDTTRAY